MLPPVRIVRSCLVSCEYATLTPIILSPLLSSPAADVVAFKGLSLYNTAKKADGIALAKEALRLSALKSATCWWVLGTLHRNEREYEDAVRCFLHATKLDPENATMLRDLAHVQLHMHDAHGALASREKLLISKPTPGIHWVGYSVVYALGGSYDLAAAVVAQFESQLVATRAASPETNELIFFRARLAGILGDHQVALKALEFLPLINGALAPSELLLDSLGATEERAALLLKAGSCVEAAGLFSELLSLNPDHATMHHGLQCALLGAPELWLSAGPCHRFPCLASDSALPAGTDRMRSLFPAYSQLAHKFPRNRVVRLVLLEILPAQHALFSPLLAAVVRGGVRKGIPTLFAELKHLLATATVGKFSHSERIARRAAEGGGISDKGVILASIAAAMFSVCKAGQGAVPVSVPVAGAWPSECDDIPATLLAEAGDSMPELPASLPWAALLHARVLDELGQLPAALAVLDSAIEHTPTVLDLYLSRARVLKHVGDLSAAAETAEAARAMDLADRYLNTKATKYLLRAGRVADAERTVSLFVRTDAAKPNANPLNTLKLNQVLWWELECADAFERAGDFAQALKRFLRVLKFFDDFVDDAFDFHGYCLRRMTLCSYQDLMAAMKHLRGHAQCLRAGLGAARCYLAVHRKPELARQRKREGVLFTDDELAAMAPADRKKAELKLRKAGKRAGEEDAAAREKAKADGKKAPSAEEEDRVAEDVDDDPFGEVVLRLPLPLEHARRHALNACNALPRGVRTAAAAAAEEAAEVAGNLRFSSPAVLGCQLRAGRVSSGWLISAQLAATAHALALDIEGEAHRPLAAAAHAAAINRIAAQFPSSIDSCFSEAATAALAAAKESDDGKRWLLA